MLRAVLDTNVLVSALIKRGENGIPDQILRRVAQFQLFASEEMLDEAARVLRYPRILKKFNLTQRQIDSYLAQLRSIATIFDSTPRVDAVPSDPSDNIILAAALKAKADFIVSGDQHLIELERFRGIPIVRPIRFLKMLKES